MSSLKLVLVLLVLSPAVSPGLISEAEGWEERWQLSTNLHCQRTQVQEKPGLFKLPYCVLHIIASCVIMCISLIKSSLASVHGDSTQDGGM